MKQLESGCKFYIHTISYANKNGLNIVQLILSYNLQPPPPLLSSFIDQATLNLSKD